MQDLTRTLEALAVAGKTLVFEEFSEAGEKDCKTASRQFWQLRIPLTHLSAECGDEGMSHPSLRVRSPSQLNNSF